MSEELEDQLDPEEREAFRAMSREQMPPAQLEDRVVETLKQENLIEVDRQRWRRRFPYIGVAAAAALLVFVLGGFVGMQWGMQWAGMQWSTTTPVATKSPQFMLVLRAGSEPSQPKSPEEVLKSVREYGNWARELRNQGLTISGEKLKQEARVLRQTDGRPVSDNRSGAGPDTIAGYFLIEAQDYEQAAKIAAGCPHLKYGGTIEVRQIEQ